MTYVTLKQRQIRLAIEELAMACSWLAGNDGNKPTEQQVLNAVHAAERALAILRGCPLEHKP